MSSTTYDLQPQSMQDVEGGQRSTDRRERPRYRIQVDLRYKLLVRGARLPHMGNGKTVDISSAGVLFETDGALNAEKLLRHPGKLVLELAWPLVLDDGCALKLQIAGRVVRRHLNLIAVSIDRYEFRTAPKLKTSSSSYRSTNELEALEVK